MIQKSEQLQDVQIALGSRIKTLRQQNGWSSQQAFATACGIDRTHLGQVERGQVNACISIVEKIAKHLNMTISDLFQDIA